MRWYPLPLLLLALWFVSCARTPEPIPSAQPSIQKTAFLSTGMNKPQVISTLGLPESSSAPEPTVEILHYRFATTGQSGSSDFIVILHNGFVTQYGKPRQGTKVINGIRIYEVE